MNVYALMRGVVSLFVTVLALVAYWASTSALNWVVIHIGIHNTFGLLIGFHRLLTGHRMRVNHPYSYVFTNLLCLYLFSSPPYLFISWHFIITSCFSQQGKQSKCGLRTENRLEWREFPGVPVFESALQHKGCGFNPWSVDKDPACEGQLSLRAATPEPASSRAGVRREGQPREKRPERRRRNPPRESSLWELFSMGWCFVRETCWAEVSPW